MVFTKKKTTRRNKDSWKEMSPTELMKLKANRLSRIEILKMEIKELDELILKSR